MKKRFMIFTIITLAASIPYEQPFAQVQEKRIQLVTREVSLGSIDPGIIEKSVVVSPDGRRVAYVARRRDKQVVVVDGQEGKEYDKIGILSLEFSPDGKRVAYRALRGDKQLVVVDGQEGKEYNEIGEGDPIFSSDATYLDSVLDKFQQRTPIFSPDGKRFAYRAQRGYMHLVVVDGQEGKEYD
ncbi:MAG: hypothetical protein V1784_00440, partial [bacterium]